ncbi:MAG: hypothetical protein ABR922_11445 [Streptosporangiaceae bacterium]|jgi:uncharacterized protein (DUF1684 family)
MTAETIDTATFGQEWAAWHRRHETVRADPHGFLAITGPHWLARLPIAVEAAEKIPPGAGQTLPEAGQTPPARSLWRWRPGDRTGT